jgi:hypothetical protein
MRYLPKQSASTNVTRFDPDKRPPLDLLPKALADLLAERDKLAESGRLALLAAVNLEDEALTLAAQAKDDAAATSAARAGQPIPKPAAVAKLEADRAEAARGLAAQEAALNTVISECADHVYLARDDQVANAAADKAKAKARTDIAALVDKLATAIEAAVEAGAAHDWIMTSLFYRDARTWPTDAIPDLVRHGLTRQNTATYSARQILSGAALAVLEDPENV